MNPLYRNVKHHSCLTPIKEQVSMQSIEYIDELTDIVGFIIDEVVWDAITNPMLYETAFYVTRYLKGYKYRF